MVWSQSAGDRIVDISTSADASRIVTGFQNTFLKVCDSSGRQLSQTGTTSESCTGLSGFSGGSFLATHPNGILRMYSQDGDLTWSLRVAEATGKKDDWAYWPVLAGGGRVAACVPDSRALVVVHR
jgi:hypothetical protein